MASLFLVLFALAASPAQAQFDVDAVTVRGASPARPRLDVYARVPHALLNFTHTPTGYGARYSVSLGVYGIDARGRQRQFVMSRSWDRSLSAATYAAARADGATDRTTQSLDLQPGRYLLQFELEDGATRRTYSREVQVQVRDVAAPFAMSDLAFIDRYDEATKEITPRVSAVVSTEEPTFQLYYEIYAADAARVRVTREVVRARGSEAAYTTTTPVTLRPGRNQFVATIPTEELRAGEYVARVRVASESGNPFTSAERRVEVQWNGLAQHVRNIGDAIAQLRYIAKDRDVRHIREATTDPERVARFRAFWTRLDPTPGTDRNERMEEYYYRVDFANQRYGRAGSGWQTDRGGVLIQFGEPDQVERHPFALGAKPYEVWYYNRLQKRLVFIDKTGFGDYQLLVPVWDERTRM